MNLKKHPGLILVFTALVTVMCRCDATEDVHREFDQTHGDPVNCVMVDYMFEYGDFSGWELSCSMPCPNGDRVLFTWHGPKVPDEFNTEEYCAVPQPGQTLPTITPRPTSTPLPTATQAPAIPMLTGDVTACSLKDGYINLRMVDRTVSGAISVQINGVTTPCTVAGTNGQVLSCALPAGAAFPITIMAAENAVPSDFFEYDGSGCAVPNDAPGGGGGDAAAPTKHPGSD
jgi:hypothetical protein